MSALLRPLQSDTPLNETVTPAVTRLLAQDDGALCGTTLVLPLVHWCTVLLALPESALGKCWTPTLRMRCP
jgi:hypothetical protein